MTSSIDLSWVEERLAVGAIVCTGAARTLVERHGVRSVVTLCERSGPPADLAPLGVAVLHLPTPDHEPLRPADLWRGVEWVRGELARTRPVLVHCRHGIGRSVLLAACVLVSLGDTPRGALAQIKAARPQASPSPEQLTALLEWSARWHARAGRVTPAVTWQELADVAYRWSPIG